MRNAGDELPVRGRLLAVDPGEVRLGLALSDPEQIVAAPLGTLPVDDVDDHAAIARAVAGATEGHDVVGIVVGLPRRLDGSEGDAARRSRRTAAALREATGLPVRVWDERFSTTEAERVMLAQDASRRERRASIDRVAASVILQGVLEAQRQRR
ncbi:MAG: Holliday junction resolvase RuvX [Actinobacteria bacterium]|nr:Holliday junction resolvase RuvX [Actinomycetota bacterium]